MLVPKKKSNYDIFHYGVTGRIGDGDNTEIHFIQTSLKMKELDNIKLLVDIPGSEKWGIKDLFQRNVDRERIVGKGGLEEYFTDSSQVKYFNPITLVLLPTDNDKIQHQLPKLEWEKNVSFDSLDGEVYINSGHYRLYKQNHDDGNIGKVEWNSEKSYVIAIDGQHRLTALKELYDARGVNPKVKDIEKWQIPVVFLIANKKIATGGSKDIITIIRKLFMYINMKSEKVNAARSILLNDESIECLCVQEIISAFHINEFKDVPNQNFPPLYLLDWLGINNEKMVLKDTRYLFGNIELRKWISEYLVGEDFSVFERKTDKLQMKRLALQDIDLDFMNDNSLLSQDDSEKIRKRFNEILRDPFLEFLTNLIPIRNYISECKEYEKENSKESISTKAFAELKYGYIHKEVSNKEDIENFVKHLQDQFFYFKKDNISDFFRQDIALRGFVYAYSQLYDIYKGYLNKSLDWSKYTDLFLPAFNHIIVSGWCESWETLNSDKKKLLDHICHSDTGKRINYKITDVKNAWGIFIIMLILDYAEDHSIINHECKTDSWDIYRDRLDSTIQKGFREVAKRDAGQLEMTAEQIKQYIKDKKEEMAEARLIELEDLWNLNNNG